MKNKHVKDNDIIEQMVSKLRAMEEMPYKAGAWEKFQAQYPTSATPKRSKVSLWIGAAAAAAAAVICTISLVDWSAQPIATAPLAQQAASPLAPSNTHRTPQTPALGTNRSGASSALPSLNLAAGSADATPMAEPINPEMPTAAKHRIDPLAQASSASVSLVSVPQQLESKLWQQQQERQHRFKDLEESSLDRGHSLASLKPLASAQAVEQPDTAPSSKSFKLASRLELGAFVSPNTTDQQVNVGGGLLLAYHISNKLSVRSGASINAYEVGLLKGGQNNISTVQMNNAPVHNAVDPVELSVIKNEFNRIIPNVDAVTGRVKTLDIPLELTYKMNKNLYLIGGLSYAMVLDQHRFEHYVENVTLVSQEKGYAALKTEVQSIQRKVESPVKNVDDNGFSGFVNLAVGRKVKAKALNLSVEPFVKIPIGKFNSSDMNYTNGGIKIITSF